MTCVVVVATDEFAGLLDRDSKLNLQTWDEALASSTQWEILLDNGWIPMFPEHFNKQSAGTPLAYQISPSLIDKWIQLSQE